jgi:hypothetical protein
MLENPESIREIQHILKDAIRTRERVISPLYLGSLGVH